MCVIAYKPQNVEFMPKKTLQECFKNNPDGAGFMFSANNRVYIRKGYMTFDDFWADLSMVRQQYGDKIPYVMHFRISTQAGVNKQCCHPYPLSSKMKDLKKLISISQIGIAHNGIISFTSDPTVKDYNDTMKFITDYATLLIKDVKWWKNHNVATALKQLCGSKLAILGGDNHCELIGDFIQDNGCYYSNSTYLEPKYKYPVYTYTKGKYSSAYDWYDGDEWEWYHNQKSKKYEFSSTYCPLTMDGDASYCADCASCERCSVLKEYEQDFEDDYVFDD